MQNRNLSPRVRLAAWLGAAFSLGVAGGAHAASTATDYLAPPLGSATLLASGNGSLNHGPLDIDGVSDGLITLDSIGSRVSSLRKTGAAAAGGTHAITAVSDWWSLLSVLQRHASQPKPDWAELSAAFLSQAEGLNGNRNASGGMNSASSVSAVAVVPLPTAVWLFGPALLAFVALVRRRA